MIERASALQGERSSKPGMSPDKFRLHIENLRSQAPVFHITPERYAEAAARNPDCADRIHVSFGWDRDIYEHAMADAEAQIGWRFPRDELARTAPALKWIHLTGAGVEHIMPLDWLPPGVVLTNNRGVHADKAGEYVAMAVLALNTRLPFYATNKVARRWEQVFASSVAGKTIVIVGVGNMGGAGAARCHAMGMHVVGVRASGAPADCVDEMVTPALLADVLPRADFLLVTVPLTPQTRKLIGREQLDLLRPSCGVINIARAGVMDYTALFDKLQRREISGAILDVFDPEPLPPDSPAWSVDNLIMTPHVSSDDSERYAIGTVELFFSNFRRFLEGQPLVNQVDPLRQY
jgi:phosphoglycerate dehydrogenase-like enzyme